IWRSPKENKLEVVVAPTPVSQPMPSVESSLPPQPAPEVVAQLNDGPVPPAYQDRVKKALTSQKLERSSQLKGLTRLSSTLVGSDNKGVPFAAVEPVGNVVVSNQPAVRWSTMEGATGYVVEVYDDQFKLVAASPQLTNRAGAITQPLARGKVYSWQ